MSNVNTYIYIEVYVINVHLFLVLTNRINGRYAELPKSDIFHKTSTRCTSIGRNLWPLLGNIFTPQPSKTTWSAQGQFDGRRLTPAQFGHDEDKSG